MSQAWAINGPLSAGSAGHPGAATSAPG
jgi:hypothetical protein